MQLHLLLRFLLLLKLKIIFPAGGLTVEEEQNGRRDLRSYLM